MELGLCIEMAWTALPFMDRLAMAADAGLRNVEMWFVDGSYQGPPDALACRAGSLGLRITNTVIGAPDGSVGGGLVKPERRADWLDRARMTLAFTRDAGIGATIVCTGNAQPAMSDEHIRSSVLDGLKATVEMAESFGVNLLLEPLNTRYDHPGYWLASSDQAAELCREVDSSRLKVLFDCYHMQIMEGDLWTHIERNLDVIGHFHAAGVPGRHEPQTGEVNYPYLLTRLRQNGYTGVFGLEYAPSCEPSHSVRTTLDYLAPWLT